MKIYTVWLNVAGHDYNALVKAKNAAEAKKAVVTEIIHARAMALDDLSAEEREDLSHYVKEIAKKKPGTVHIYDEGT